MNSIILVIAITLSFVNLTNQQQWETSEITAYQFHTYFFQNNEESAKEALIFRESIQELSDSVLSGCRLNRINYAPIGPHIIGSYETCCNSSAFSKAQSYFMQNHGNLSILLHPLTRYEVLDHTTRAMWMGKDMPLDISNLNEDLGPNYHYEAKCLPIDLSVGGGAVLTMPRKSNLFLILIAYLIIVHKHV